MLLAFVNQRFESAETASRSKTDAELREELLRKLIDRELLGGTAQIMLESSIKALPLRELPPGSTSSLFLMYLAYIRTTGDPSGAASRSTFYNVAKLWRPCLRFRRKTEHSLCFECSRLKSLIHGCKDPWPTIGVGPVCCMKRVSRSNMSNHRMKRPHAVGSPWNSRILNGAQDYATSSSNITTSNGQTDSGTGPRELGARLRGIYCAPLLILTTNPSC